MEPLVTQVVSPGYCWREVSYTWVTRVSTTPIAVGDDVGVWVSLGWSFPFFGVGRSRVYVCSNGFLIFDPTSVTNDWSNSFAELKTRCKIAAFWDDLRTDIAGGIVSTPGVYVDSYTDRVIITWEATRFGASADSIMFQALLFRNGTIRVSINGATNFANFSPTIGASGGDGRSWYDITPKSGASKTWLLAYDHECFMWERPGVVGPWPWQYIRKGSCLMIPGGYEDPTGYGECGCGPIISRNYAPDYWYPYWGSNYFWSDIKWYVNQYSAAQSITGHSYCYVTEFRIATAYGDYDHLYSTLPNAEYHIGEKETWGGQTTKGGEIFTRTPEQIVAGKIYWADAYFTMTTGVPKGSTAYEYEMKIDNWPYYQIHPGGYPLDWWKVYWASIYSIERPHDCEDPNILSVNMFQWGAIAVQNTSESTIVIRTMSAINSKDSLMTYINSRTAALNQIIENSDPEIYIPVTITFTAPLTPETYIKFCEQYRLKPAYYRFVSLYGSGISTVRDPEQPFRWDFARDLWEGRKDAILGITAVYGLVKVESANKLKSARTVLLIDPQKDLIVQEYINYYSRRGNEIVVHYPDDIWVEYKLYG